MYQEGLSGEIEVAYQHAAIGPGDKVMIFNGDGYILLKSVDQEAFFTYGEIRAEAEELDQGDFYFLFAVKEEKYYLLTGAVPEAVKGIEPLKRRDVFNNCSNELSYLVLTAAHIYDWHNRTRYCGACGSETVLRTDERAKICPTCGNRIYPQINPAVIVGVSNGDKLLLTKYANRDHSRYALIAGFVEVGETLEMAVKREVMEETGVRVKNIRYFDSQPWGITGGLLSGFFADLDGDETITMDEEELKEAAWIPRDQVQELDLSMRSLTSTMMDAWRQKNLK